MDVETKLCVYTQEIVLTQIKNCYVCYGRQIDVEIKFYSHNSNVLDGLWTSKQHCQLTSLLDSVFPFLKDTSGFVALDVLKLLAFLKVLHNNTNNHIQNQKPTNQKKGDKIEDP